MDEAELLERYGQTYAEEAGITLHDKPAPLYQLLVLTNLLSHRISAELAVQGAKALFEAGYRTPEHMRDASWQQRVDALGRGNFRRYDESTATTLGEVACMVIDRWQGDLRKLKNDDPHARLQEFKGIGPTGADIFMREVQAVWRMEPFIDSKVKEGARLAGLPLEKITGTPQKTARLASALVRYSLDH